MLDGPESIKKEVSIVRSETQTDAELIAALSALSAGDRSVRLSGDSAVAAAFNDMAEKLASRDSERVDLIASVAHDLRSPMTSIVGFVDGILNGAIGPEGREKYLNIIKNECLRLSELVAQLLDLSRIQSGDRKFKRETFDICERARVVLISLERRIEEKRLDVEFVCEQDRMLALGDGDAMHQVLYNLCDNAVKYAKEGGKYIIELKSDLTDASCICVSVYNEGDGVPYEKLPYIFDRYYKVDGSAGREKVSTGLGLYISKLIVEALGGAISAESEPLKWFRASFTVKKA